MFPYTPVSYDKISNYLLNLISNLNMNIKLISGIVDELLMIDKFNKSGDFLKFVFQFRQGLFLSIKCEGYLELLVTTKYYTSPILCYILTDAELVHKILNKAIDYLDNVETANYAVNNADFKKLITEIKNTSIILNALPDVIKLYDLNL